MNPYKLQKGAMTGVSFFGFLAAMIVNANFLPWGLLVLAPICILITYFVLGRLFKILDKPIGKSVKSDKNNKSSE